jgi:hypothetical protein
MSNPIQEFPITTAEVRALVGCCDNRVTCALRSGTVKPKKILGRLAWDRHDVLALAKHLGLDSPAVRNACTPVVPAAGASDGGRP